MRNFIVAAALLVFGSLVLPFQAAAAIADVTSVETAYVSTDTSYEVFSVTLVEPADAMGLIDERSCITTSYRNHARTGQVVLVSSLNFSPIMIGDKLPDKLLPD